MSPTIQTAVALLLVAGAMLFFAMRLMKKRTKSGCGGGCGCSAARTGALKEKQK